MFLWFGALGEFVVRPMTLWERIKARLGWIKYNEPMPLPPKPKAKVYCAMCRHVTLRARAYPSFCSTRQPRVLIRVEGTAIDPPREYWGDPFADPQVKNANNDCPDFETLADYLSGRSQTS